EMRAPSRLSYGRIPNLVELKDLIATQLESFRFFKSDGLRELFDEINPITDYTGKNFELKFLDYEFGQPKFSVEECRNRDMTYAAPLRIRTRLTIKETGEIKESEVYMGDFAMMTEEGTFFAPSASSCRSWCARRACTSPPPRTPTPGASCSAPSSSPTAARGSRSRPRPRTCSRSRSTASARSPSPSCSRPSSCRR